MVQPYGATEAGAELTLLGPAQRQAASEGTITTSRSAVFAASRTQKCLRLTQNHNGCVLMAGVGSIIALIAVGTVLYVTAVSNCNSQENRWKNSGCGLTYNGTQNGTSAFNEWRPTCEDFSNYAAQKLSQWPLIMNTTCKTVLTAIVQRDELTPDDGAAFLIVFLIAASCIASCLTRFIYKNCSQPDADLAQTPLLNAA